MTFKSLFVKGFLVLATVPAVAAAPALLDLEYRPLAGKTAVNLNEQQGGKVLLFGEVTRDVIKSLAGGHNH